MKRDGTASAHSDVDARRSILLRRMHGINLRRNRFSEDLMSRGIPLTKGLDLTSFLVDMGTIGDWNLDGLPTDPLSIQNGILVSMSQEIFLPVDTMQIVEQTRH